MRYKLTILLLVLNAALAGIIFYLDKVQSTRDLIENASRLILDPDFVRGIEQITIESADAEIPWVLERDAETWSVSSPLPWKANPYAVDQLLFQLQRLTWQSRFPVSDLESAGQSLDSYDLETPPLHIKLRKGDQTVILNLGTPTEIGNRLYLMTPDDDSIYVVSRGLLDSLQRDPDAFLERRLFTLSVEETRSVQIQDRASSNVRVRLERSRDDWAFVSPIETDADPERVDSFISYWLGQEIEAFLPETDLPAGQDGNSLRLTFQAVSERETLILVPDPDSTAQEPVYLARMEAYPAVFRIQSESVEKLRRVQEDLREKRVLAAAGTDWTSMELGFGSLGLTLQQLETGEWQILYTGEADQLQSMPGDLGTISQLQSLFAALEAERFITDAPSEADLQRFGLSDPQRLLLLRKGGETQLEFRIGGVFPDGEETLLYARTNASDSVFLVRPYILASLSLDPYAYRERAIRTLPETAEIGDIRLVDRESGAVIPLILEDEAVEATVERTQLLRAFVREIRVDRFLNRPFSDPLILGGERVIDWPYILETDITYPTVANPSETVRLYLSERVGGTSQYVGDPESGLVGFLTANLIEALDPVLAELPATPSPPEEVEALESGDPAP